MQITNKRTNTIQDTNVIKK